MKDHFFKHQEKKGFAVDVFREKASYRIGELGREGALKEGIFAPQDGKGGGKAMLPWTSRAPEGGDGDERRRDPYRPCP